MKKEISKNNRAAIKIRKTYAPTEKMFDSKKNYSRNLKYRDLEKYEIE